MSENIEARLIKHLTDVGLFDGAVEAALAEEGVVG